MRRLVLLATIVALPVMSGEAWALWDCKAYSDFAIRDVNKAKAAQCNFTGPRWSSDPGLHYGFCVERLSANDDNAMTSETNIRETEVAACEQRFQCTGYAKTAIQAVSEANQLGCGFQPPRWSTDEGLHYGYCIERSGAGDQFAISNETAIRATELAACKASKVTPPAPPAQAETPPATAPTTAVKLDVDLYDQPVNGNKGPIVRAGTIVTVGECRPNDMCSIAGGGHVGWIYDGPTYDTLDRP